MQTGLMVVRKTNIMLAFVAMSLIATQASPEPPSDFVLRVAYGRCWNETIDTTGPTFSRTLSPGETVAAEVPLTPEQHKRLYALVAASDIWGYPRLFESEGETMVEELPPSEFTIEVQANGRRTIVQWLDRGSMHPDAVRLRSMLRAVRELFAERPEVQRLPSSRMVCL
jgi:hypothetical protein